MNMMRTTQCNDQPDMHECKTEVTEGGVRRTIVERKVCCHGHRRTPGTLGCQEVILEPLVQTVEGLGGREFLALVEDQGLMDQLAENVTVFLPTDDAVEDFHHDLQSINSVNNGDVGLLERRRRSPPSPQQLPSLKEVLLGHLVPSLLPTSSMSDEGEVATMATSGSKIRLTVYNTFPQKVVMANCARVTSSDHMARDGLVHMVDKVLLPATKNVVDLMRSELKTGSFLNALGQVDGLLKELEGEGQFTVFAPTDKAMEALEPALKQMLEEGKDCAGEVIRNHVLPNVVCSGVVEGRVKTNNLLSSLLLLSRSEAGEVMVEGSKLIIRDMMATNGVVHLIDRVLVPTKATTLASALKARPLLSSLIETAGLSEQFASLTNATLFLPSEEAIKELPEAQLEQLKEEPQSLKDLLSFHVSQPQVTSGSFLPGLINSNLPNQKVRINSYSSGLLSRKELTAQCARLTHEQKVCGSTIYTVDKLLLPPVGNLLEMLSGNPSHSRFLDLIKATNLSEVVNLPARTLIVPTNQAFDNLEDEVAARLEEDPAFAKETVERHLLKEVVCCAGIHRNNILFNTSRKRTESGQLVSVRRSASGHLYADKAEITKCDMVSNNGVAHQVDALLLPRRSHGGQAQERRSDAIKNIFNFNPFKLF